MEAIAGILHTDPRRPASIEVLQQVARVLGVTRPTVATDGSFGLAVHRHIIDPVGQHPSIADNGSAWLVVTGEIEHRQQLLQDLEKARLRPTGTTDADVLLGLFQLHGPYFVERVHGFFNIVVWDGERRRLLLYADRCGGVKAVYYHQRTDVIAFGSCVRAVIAQHDVPRRMDPTALEEVLILGHPIPPRTLFQDVRLLEAGTFLECADGQVEVRRYWTRLPYLASQDDFRTLTERYFSALRSAVERSMETPAEVGILLSGGVDSAALVSLLHRAGHRGLKTYSMHLGKPGEGDVEASRRIADLYQTDHRCIEGLDHRSLDPFPEMLWHYECPGMDLHPTYRLSHQASQHCDLVIGGYGNDLIWGCVTAKRWTGWWPLGATPAPAMVRYLSGRRRMSRRELRRLHPRAPRTDVGLLARVGGLATRTGHAVTDFIGLDEGLFGDQQVYREVGKLVVDAHSLWIRMPYTDSSVTSIAEAVPLAARSRTGPGGHTELKSFFKDLMLAHDVLPPEVIYRPKTWMRSPTAEWLRGRLGDDIATLVLSRSALDRGYFDRDQVQRRFSEHRSGTADHSYALMMLAAVELWHRIFIDPPSIAKPEWTLSQQALADSPPSGR